MNTSALFAGDRGLPGSLLSTLALMINILILIRNII
jgi:hypothetical protein